MAALPLHLATPKVSAERQQRIETLMQAWVSSWFCSTHVSVRHSFGFMADAQEQLAKVLCYTEDKHTFWLEYDEAAFTSHLLDSDNVGENNQLHSSYIKLLSASFDDMVKQALPNATKAASSNPPFLLDKYIYCVEAGNSMIARLIVPAEWLGLATAILAKKRGAKLSKSACLEPMLQKSDMAIDVTMPLETITLGELMDLSPGDVIQSPSKVTDKFQVKINGRHLTDCYLGKKNDSKAILF
jgi:flagellar motor switch/type III secretory pathway protein FliN